MSLPPPLRHPRPASLFRSTPSPMPPPSHNWHPTTPLSHRKLRSTSSLPNQTSTRQSARLLTASSPPSTARKSLMRLKLRSMTKPIASCRKSSRNTPRRLTRSSSSRAAPMGRNLMTAASRPSSPSERDSLCPPSSSNSEMTGESYVYQGRSITRTRMQLTSFSTPITHHKTSPSPSLSGSTLCSMALPPPTILSVEPLLTSMTGMPPPKSSAIANKTTDYATSVTNSPSSRPRYISLRTTSWRAAIASKPPTSRPAFRIWREEPGRKTTLHTDAPLGEELVEDQVVQTRTGGDDTVVYPHLRVVRANWA
jgi:hypothetical protein